MALVVFLRGANVGGHRRFRPSILARALIHYDVVNVGARPVPLPVTGIAMTALAVSVIGILYLGILPTQVIDIAQASVATIF